MDENRFVVAIGFWRWLLKRYDACAITMPWGKIYVLDDWQDDYGLQVHELAHINQIRRDGAMLFTLKYLWWQLRYGYYNNPYEVEARKIEFDLVAESFPDIGF